MHFLYERHRRLMEAEIESEATPVVGDFLFEKDKIFAYINLDNEELKLYEKYFDMLGAFGSRAGSGDLPAGHAGGAAQARVEKRRSQPKPKFHPEYLEAVANAYEHFFFRYSGSNLLVVDTSEIDFVERNDDLQELLRRLRQPVKGTQYFLPLGQS